MNQNRTESFQGFDEQELLALKLFYAGERARRIRTMYCDPWAVVSRHRNMPKDQYEEVKARLAQIPTPAQIGGTFQ